MSSTLGEDWRSFFNMVYCNSGKPAFFGVKERPFYLMNQDVPSFKGKEITSGSDLIEDSSLTYLEGNAHIVTDYLKVRFNIEAPRVCFFGDQYGSDAHSASLVENWDGIVVIEELSMAHEEY